MKEFYLAIIREDSRMNDRILQRFENVVEIAAAAVGRITLRPERHVAGQFRESAAEAAYRHHPVLATFAADEDLIAHMPVIPVDGRRPADVELDRFGVYLAHGAVPDDALAAVAATDCAEPSFG